MHPEPKSAAWVLVRVLVQLELVRVRGFLEDSSARKVGGGGEIVFGGGRVGQK